MSEAVEIVKLSASYFCILIYSVMFKLIFLNNIYDEFHGRHKDCVQNIMKLRIKTACYRKISCYRKIGIME